MFGLDIAAIVKNAMASSVLAATLTKRTAGTRGADPTAGTNPTEVSYACRGFIDSQAGKNRAGELVRDKTVRIVLLGDTIDNGSGIAPEPGDTVSIEGRTYTIEGGLGTQSSVIERDPAAATYTFSARAI